MGVKSNIIFEKITNIVLDILIFIFGLILLGLIYQGVQVKVLGNDYSSFFGYSIFEVQTGSMTDAVNIGDWIIVKNQTKYELNDIVTYEKNGEYITHRIVETYKGTFITQGDANPSKDEPISQEQIVGSVVKILPHFGILKKTIFNIPVLIALIVTVYLFNMLFKKKKEGSDDSMNFIDKVKEKIMCLYGKGKKQVDTFVNESKKQIEEMSLNTIESKTEEFVETKKEELKDFIEEKKEELEKTEETLDTISIETDDQVQSNSILPEEQTYNAEELKETIDKPLSEDDLNKTIFFRAISVDKSELSDTFSEINENEKKEKSALEKAKSKIKPKKVKKELDDESLITSTLEMLQKKKSRKCKNIISKVMLIKTEEINEIINLLNNGEKSKSNEESIKNCFTESYIDAKYYNYCGDINVEYNSRNMTIKLEDLIKKVADKLLNEYKGPDTKYLEKVKKYTNYFMLINSLDQNNELFDGIKEKREIYTKRFIKYFRTEVIEEAKIKYYVEEIIKIQKLYRGMVDYCYKKLETNVFNVTYNSFAANKYLQAVDLEHNLSFSKVYSDYVVDKAYSEGIVAEDKVGVLVSLLLIKISQNMLDNNFRNKYILYIPGVLFEKENKLNKILKMMEDEFAKNNIYILVKYNDLIKNKKNIKELRKQGYRFALVFDKTIEVKAKDQGNIAIAEYIFINKKEVDTALIVPSIPEDLSDNIIYDDIVNKVGIVGGE